MHKLTKRFCLLLAFALLAAAGVGCKEEKAEGSDTVKSGTSSLQSSEDGGTTPESTESLQSAAQVSSKTKTASELFGVDTTKKSPDPLEQGVNLKGYEFTIIDFNKDSWDRTTGKTKRDDARIAMLKKIESKLNCKIKFVYAPYGNFFKNYQPSILAGEKVADVLSPTLYEAGAFIQQKMLTDYSKVPNLHIDRVYWNQTIKKNLAFNGKVYVANSTFNSPLMWSSALYYNKAIAKELNLGDLYQLVRRKKWTIDEFNRMAAAAKKDIDGTAGFGANDRYGLAGHVQTNALQLFLGSGISMLTNNNGRIEFNLKPSKTAAVNADAVNQINKLKRVCVMGDLANPVPDGQEWSKIAVDQFATGKSLFFLYVAGFPGHPDHAAKFRNMKDDFGILPIPTAKEGANYTCWVDWNIGSWMIPVTNKDLSKTGIILESLAYHNYYDTNTLALTEWSDTFLRDDDSTEMLALIQDSSFYDYVQLSAFADERIANIINKIIVPSAIVAGSNPTAEISRYEDSVRKGIDDFFNS